MKVFGVLRGKEQETEPPTSYENGQSQVIRYILRGFNSKTLKLIQRLN